MTDKQTIVLIHGLSETREIWGKQVPFLERHANVVAYDVRGFGASPTGAGAGTVDQLADDLAQLVSATAHGPAWLVGFSMGGVIAQRLALDFAHLVEGLVLVASSSTVGRAGQAFFRERIDLVTRRGLEGLAELNANDALGCFSPGHDELVAQYQRLRVGAVREAAGYLNACHAMLALKDGSLTEGLGAIDRPTLVVAGELDPYCPPRASQMIADAIPGAGLEVLSGAGHCMQWESADTINELIAQFIEKQDAGT